MSLVYDKFTGRHLYECRNVLEKTQWMKKEQLQRLQLRKLKALLRHAYENVPYYHESFKKNGFLPNDFSRLEDMQKIPVLKRTELRLKFEELIARNAKKSELVPCKTSGTTAAPVKFYRSKVELTWDMAAELRGYGWAGYETGAKLIYIRRIGPNDVLAGAKYRIERFLNRWKLVNTQDLSEKSMSLFASRMNGFKPDFALGSPSPTNIFAVFLQENSQYRIRLKAVFTYGQTLLPHYRKAIEKAFGCKVYDNYGSTEMAHIAAQCGHHEGHHVTQENVFLEVEKDEEATVRGEEGKVLLTDLNNCVMPFIRYDIGDLGTILADDCSCGRGLSLFKLTGRDYEYFVHSDGAFTLFRDVQTVFEDLPIEDYQIVQQSLDEIVIRIIRKAGYAAAHTDFILKHISKRIADIAEVRIELVDSIPLTGFGKVKHFVKIPTKYT